MKTEREELQDISLFKVKKEMAMPRMAQSAQHENRRLLELMRSNIDAPPRISFNFAGVDTLNESFATEETIFSEGDTAETLMYIRTGFVRVSATTKTYEEAIVEILGPGEFLGEGCLGSQN